MDGLDPFSLQLTPINGRKPHPTALRHTIGMGCTLPQSTHDRAAELHNLASHAHAAAATAHGKGDHLSAHELSRQAHEHSANAQKYSEQLVKEAVSSSKVSAPTT
jgi:hypothetical protein